MLQAGLTLLIGRSGPDKAKSTCCRLDNGFAVTRSYGCRVCKSASELERLN